MRTINPNADTQKAWTDQPDLIEDSIEVTNFYAGKAIHVYKRDGLYYITTGNLFGSQTIAVGPDADKVIKVIGIAASKDEAKLPAYCSIVPNCH